jgi:peptide chain release factor 3
VSARSGLPFRSALSRGHQTPVYFGSALKNFGVRNLLSFLALNAPPPGPAPARGRTVEPSDGEVTGFVFKVQANMDPNHRDRVAFLRLASGKFRRGMKLVQSGTGKSIGIHNPILFFAQERETLDEAYPGDIIGIPNHGVLRVGDTAELAQPSSRIPTAPEILRRVRLRSHEAEASGARPGKSGGRGRDAACRKSSTGSSAWSVRCTDVLRRALTAEYGLDVPEPAPYETARWLGADADMAKFMASNRGAWRPTDAHARQQLGTRLCRRKFPALASPRPASATT